MAFLLVGILNFAQALASNARTRWDYRHSYVTEVAAVQSRLRDRCPISPTLSAA
jgi:hypothetical protein